MKYIKAIALILSISIFSIIINSCCEGYFYRWTYIITENLLDGSPSNADSIPKEKFGIRSNFFEQKYSNEYQFGFINQAVAAYDCWEIYTKEDSIIDINIYSVNRFNSDFRENSDITHLFIPQYGTPPTDTNNPYEEVIANINQNDIAPVENVDFTLREINVHDSIHQFIIKLSLSNNTQLIDTTPAVRLY